MCGRFSLTSKRKNLVDYLKIDCWDSKIKLKPSYNIFPTQKIPVLLYKNGRVIQNIFWGLVPKWSKNIKIGSRLINARVETLTKKPAYAQCVRSQRCIIIADGYYEWRQGSRGKQPYYIYNTENSILPFAGLWEQWENNKKQYRLTCTIITTESIGELKIIHNRMPIILRADKVDTWIDCSHSQDEALEILKPYYKGLNYYPVSKSVNTVMNNSHKCIEPIMMEENEIIP